MEEGFSWKIIIIAAVFSLVVLAGAYYLISPRESEYFTEEKTDKIAEFKATRVSGRKEGKLLWEFFAMRGWTTQNRDVTYLDTVNTGRIYNKEGRLIVANLTSPRATAYQRAEMIEVFGLSEGRVSGESLLRADLNIGRMSGPQRPSDWVKLKSDSLRYTPGLKRTEMTGKVELFKKDFHLKAGSIIIDHEKNLADITGDVRISISEGRIQSRILTRHASFYSGREKEITIPVTLEVVQGKKIALAEEGLYSNSVKQLIMKRQAKAVFEKAAVVLQSETARNLKSPEARELLKNKTVLTSDELVFSTRNGDASAYGSVHVTQKGKEAKSDQAVYNDKDETMLLSGDVYMRKGKQEWVRAKQVRISVKDETFEAVGSVEAEFNL